MKVDELAKIMHDAAGIAADAGVEWEAEPDAEKLKWRAAAGAAIAVNIDPRLVELPDIARAITESFLVGAEARDILPQELCRALSAWGVFVIKVDGVGGFARSAIDATMPEPTRSRIVAMFAELNAVLPLLIAKHEGGGGATFVANPGQGGN